MSEPQIKVVVVADDKEQSPVALRAGHLVTMTEYDHEERRLTVWVEPGPGYVKATWPDREAVA